MNKPNTPPILLTLLGILAIASPPSLAETAAGDDEELSSLLLLLDEETTIATKSRLNADYVPGMVNVLQGDELEARGLRTVWDALALVPGIDTSYDATGVRQIISRGVGRIYGSGNIKLLLNNISMNSSGYAQANMLLNMPVEQVERIEVIRGPGSAVYGEFAYVGVINVITRNQGRRINASLGANQLRGGTATLASANGEGSVGYHLNIGAWSRGISGTNSGLDMFHGEGLAADSNAPGDVADAMAFQSLLLGVDYRGLELKLSQLQDLVGDHFGVNYLLPPGDEGGSRNRQRDWQLSYQANPNDDWELNLTLGGSRTARLRDGLFLGYADELDPLLYGHDMHYGDIHYRESRGHLGLDAHWRGLSDHKLLLALEHSRTRIDEASWRFYTDTYEVTTYAFGGVSYPLGDSFLEVGAERRTDSITVQDEYQLSERVTLTAGLRHDRYSDLDDATTPRLAAVYRHDHYNIFKFQYAQAFRPTTFYEAGYGGSTPERIDNLEFGYIRRGHDQRLAATLFYARMRDLIDFWDQSGYSNVDLASVRGLELEARWQLGARLQVDGNLTLLKSEEATSAAPIYGSADTMGNLAIDYRLGTKTQLHLGWRHVGARNRQPFDSRDKLAGYDTINLGLNLTRLFDTNLNARLGVSNLLDSERREPAPATYSTQPPYNLLPAYPDDYPGIGRQWRVQLSYAY